MVEGLALVFAAARVPDFHVYVRLIFQVMQGMGLAGATLPASAEADDMRRRVRALVAQIVREAFASAPAQAP